MSLEHLLPGTVIALKLFFRLFVGQTVNRVEAARVVLAFPIDLAFLAVSFAAVFLGHLQVKTQNPLSTSSVLGLFLLYVIVAGCVTLFSKKSDCAFILDDHLITVVWMIPAYFLSLAAVVLSLWTWTS